jgi:hypothetical protein
MARALESRIAKLEKGDRGTDDGRPFYLLWVSPGEDRAKPWLPFKRKANARPMCRSTVLNGRPPRGSRAAFSNRSPALE